VIILLASIPLSLKQRIQQIQLGLLHTLTYTYKLTVSAAFERNFTTIFYCELAYINIPGASIYGLCISQLIRYSRASGSDHDFIDRGLLLSRQLMNQRFLVVNLKSSLRKFCCRHHDLVSRYIISVSQMTKDKLHLS